MKCRKATANREKKRGEENRISGSNELRYITSHAVKEKVMQNFCSKVSKQLFPIFFLTYRLYQNFKCIFNAFFVKKNFITRR